MVFSSPASSLSELGIALNGIKNIKERYPHFELEIEQNATRTPVFARGSRKLARVRVI